MTKRNEQTLASAIDAFGPDMQMTVAIEEMSELTKELCKVKRKGVLPKTPSHTYDALAEEIADVYIMLRQLEMIFDNASEVDAYIEQKLTRLRIRVLGKKIMGEEVEK